MFFTIVALSSSLMRLSRPAGHVVYQFSENGQLAWAGFCEGFLLSTLFVQILFHTEFHNLGYEREREPLVFWELHRTF